MEKFSKEKIIGAAATVLVHALVVVLLYFLILTPPVELPEKGVEVMIGVDVGSVADARLDAAPQAAPEPVPVQPAPSAPEEQLMTQDIEESLALPPEEAKKPEKTLEEIQKEKLLAERLEQERLEKEEAERLEQERLEKERLEKEEAERLEQERLEKERREEEARKAAENSIANAFSKGSLMNKKTESEKDETAKGSVQGNSNAGKTDDVGISFSLEGRDPLGDGIVVPKEKLQSAGKVVVNITVNPVGNVIDASINPDGTDTADMKLRNAALKAARATVFSSIAGVDNQRGTITYNFKLK